MIAPWSSTVNGNDGAHLLPTGFHVHVDEPEHPAVLHLQGELDMATASQLRAALGRAMAGDAPVTLDLSELTFIDSTGVAVLVAASRRARHEGRTFCVRSPRGTVRKTLRLAGADRLLAIMPAQAAAG